MLHGMDQPLTPSECADFHREGFVVRPAFFPADLMQPVIRELDGWEAAGWPDPYTMPGHGALISHPPLMEVIGQLCGPQFLFHHLNTYRHDTGAPGVPWHNDYEQVPQTNRSHLNLIALIYPDGLHGAVGDLVVVPRSQHLACPWEGLSFFGTAPLPGEVVIDNLPPGSVVLASTGLLHCRRAREGAGPRYFTDTSYVQRGIPWPSTCQYDWQRMYVECRRLGYAREGRYEHLFDETQFFDRHEAQRRFAGMDHGSVYTLLPRE